MERLGDYEINRQEYDLDLVQRALAIQALDAVDMAYLVPIDPMEDLQCDSCQ